MKTIRLPKTLRKTGHHIGRYRLTLLTLLVVASLSPAETITIGKGQGVVWEGLPFNAPLNGPMGSSLVKPHYGLLAISTSNTRCTEVSALTTISGYTALQIAPGVGLVPRATGTAQYVRFDGTEETLSGTLGLPESRGTTSAGTVITNPVGNFTWCLPPAMADDNNFYSALANRRATISGTWVMVADGTQTSGETTIRPMYAGSFAQYNNGDQYQIILPSSIILRITTLSCTVATPTAVNFGGVERKTQAGSELAALTNPITVSCSQDSDQINANINLQFRAISGLYDNAPGRLALQQGGGYITGTLSESSSDGACNGSGGITFDGTPIEVGSIGSNEASKVINSQVIWRLCSGGASLPTGPVDASTELLVTFN